MCSAMHGILTVTMMGKEHRVTQGRRTKPGSRGSKTTRRESSSGRQKPGGWGKFRKLRARQFRAEGSQWIPQRHRGLGQQALGTPARRPGQDQALGHLHVSKSVSPP